MVLLGLLSDDGPLGPWAPWTAGTPLDEILATPLLSMVVDIPSPLNMGSYATLLLENETQVDSTVVALRYKMGFLTLRSVVNYAPNSASTVAGRHRAVEAAAWWRVEVLSCAC